MSSGTWCVVRVVKTVNHEFLFLNKISKEDKQKIRTIRMSEQIIIDFFIECLVKSNYKISLEEAISKFENIPSNMTLKRFAEEKGRTREGYLKTYEKLFYHALLCVPLSIDYDFI